MRFLRLLALLALFASPLSAQTARDSTHVTSTKAARDSVARIFRLYSLPAYGLRNWTKLVRAESTLVAIVAPVPVPTPTPVPAPVPTPTLVPHFIAISPSSGTIAVGGTLQLSGVVMDDKGTAIALPVVWTAAPSSVASVNSSGLVTGIAGGTVDIVASTPTAPTATRQVTLTVSAPSPTPTPTPTPDPVPPISTTGFVGPAAMAELPRVVPATDYPATGRAVKVCATCDLQAALNTAVSGDVLLLAPGASYIGNYILPNKGAAQSWIVVRTDTTLSTTGRMTPSTAARLRLAKVLTTSNEAAIATAPGAHHWRITGLELGGTATAQEISGIVRFGTTAGEEPTLASLANNLILDRAYVHGTPTQSVRRCVALNSGAAAIIDSWISECHSNNNDSQAIAGFSGAGPFLITNNELSGGHEVVMFGGADPVITNLVASDITFTKNHVTRPTADKGVWQDKNLFELKSAKRILLEGNIFENNWADAQSGYAILIKSNNQDGGCPGCGTQDVTMVNNILRKTGNGLNIAGILAGPAIPMVRVTIRDLLVDSLNVGPYSADGIPLQLLEAATDVSLSHVTFLGRGTSMLNAISFDGQPMVRMAIVNTVFPPSAYGVKGSAQAPGSGSLNFFAPGGLFSTNMLVGGDCSTAPTTLCPATLPATLPLGSDGLTIGADLAKISAATSGVIVAP